MSNLDKAIAVASKVHAGQLDKAGQPYVLHPLRLMFRFQSDVEMIVAVLHDAVEDSNLALDDLKSLGFSDVVLKALDCLSKRAGETYEEFIERVSENDLAKKIKIEDIKDNLNLTRLNNIIDKDLTRVKKYHQALKFLVNHKSMELLRKQ